MDNKIIQLNSEVFALNSQLVTEKDKKAELEKKLNKVL